jgi:hypothetical protein
MVVIIGIDEVFSLTPALSRWEREKCSQHLGETKAEFSL